MKLRALVSLLITTSVLVACGGGGSGAGTSPFGAGSGSTTTTSGSTASNSQSLVLTVQLLDSNDAVTTALTSGAKLRVKVTLTKGGVAQKAQLVQLSLEQAANYGVLDQLTALTDDSGVAVVQLTAGTDVGAGRVKATAKLDDGTEVSGAANFVSSGTSTQTTSLTLANFAVDTSTVSAYGTTGFSVKVLNNNATYSTPVTVSFASDCPSGKAVVTSSAVTRTDGVAVGTFQDNGCAGASSRSVVLTASIGTSTPAVNQFTVLPSSVGSLRFVSVSPSDASITLKGQGGSGRQENATLIFKLVDQAGNGVANADVCFDSSTYVGGLKIDGYNDTALPPSQGSAALCGNYPDDPLAKVRYVKRTDSSGNVSVQVASGTVPTPVRLRARTLYPLASGTVLTTYSDALSISTGLPLQRSFSLSVDKANLDGGNGTAGGGYDGEEAVFTVRLADQFSNPVPDGTKVTFIASGGAVCTSQNGSCSTVNGSCSCKFTTQARRPNDGRVVVLAYADGLEDYTDANGNNQFDEGESFADLSDAYVDANKSGTYSGVLVNNDVDIPIPYKNGTFATSGDGVRGNAHIRASSIIYMSAPTGTGDPSVVIPNKSLTRTVDLLNGGGSDRYLRVSVAGCETNAPQISVPMFLDDGFGNPMASGTALTASDFSDNLSLKSFKPASVLAFGARAPSSSIDGASNGNGGNVIKVLPWPAGGNVTTQHTVTVAGAIGKCSGVASFVLDAKSPRGATQTVRVLYEGEARLVDRYGFDVRFADPLMFGVSKNLLSVTLNSATLNLLVDTNGAAVGMTAYSINWGDGSSVVSGTGSTILQADRVHDYASAGTYTVTLSVVGQDGLTRTNSTQVTVVSSN